jgi:hypothetical protein
LVGTPEFSTNIESAAADPLPFDNIMYSFHYYTGVSGENYEERIVAVKESGIGIFVTEWGISNAPDSGVPDFEKAGLFLDFLRRHRISWAIWSLCNKDEIYSAISPASDSLSDWNDDELTEDGRFIFEALGG